MAKKLKGSVRLKRPPRLNTKGKDILYIVRDKNAKGRSQAIHGVTGKLGLEIQNSRWRPTDFYQENTLVIASILFQQHKRRLYTWTSPDGQHENQIDYILCSQKWGCSIQSAKTRLGADCGSDHEQFSSVQSLSHVRLFATPWIAAHQAPLSIIITWSLLKLMPIELVMPFSRLILCHPFLPLPPIPPSIRVFSNESTLCMRWPKYWSFSFSISPSNEYPGLISFRMDWLDLLAVQGTLKSLLQHHSSKASFFWLIAKFRFKFKSVGKTTRPFRYDLNQTPYDYTVEMGNRFKGLDLIDRVPDELCTEVHDIVQETGSKTIPKKKKCKKARWLFEEALQKAVKRREAKSKAEKERYTHLNAES